MVKFYPAVVAAAMVSALLLTGCASMQAPSASSAGATSVQCLLKPAASGYAGSCQVPCSVNALAINFDGVDAKRACSEAARSVDVSLARTAVAGRWLGTMQGVKPEDPTRLEIVPGKAGAGTVARTPFGWFAVMGLRESADSMQLQIDTRRQVRPTADDLAIIERAITLLPDNERWNKNDNRQCSQGATKLSLFCALMQASTEISGGVHYRQPAMQAVREELNLVDAQRIKTHRIMDYNNHPDTTLAEVHALMRRAKARVVAEVR
jgi:hypothetical protein